MQQGYLSRIFNIQDQQHFAELAMEAFRFQTANNRVYCDFMAALRINPSQIKTPEAIPFLPIQFFKSHKVYAGPSEENQMFTSSGTTGMETSKHYVYDLSFYEESFHRAFELFYGGIRDYCILALLPSYLEREGSSLVYMADQLIRESKHPLSGFYLNNLSELAETIEKLKYTQQKVILLGVSYALLDLADFGCRLSDQFIVMETGGMKGKRKEMIKEELHQYLCNAFGVSEIHSEYGMTELLSQAYSKGQGIYHTPPWMKIKIREVNDPFTPARQGKTGGINVIDLANIYSCPFIATQDLGRLHADGSFEVLGRFDNSDIRGCNLLVE